MGSEICLPPIPTGVMAPPCPSQKGLKHSAFETLLNAPPPRLAADILPTGVPGAIESPAPLTPSLQPAAAGRLQEAIIAWPPTYICSERQFTHWADAYDKEEQPIGGNPEPGCCVEHL